MSQSERAEPMDRAGKWRIRRRLAILAIVMTGLGLFHRFLFLGNFDVVKPGRVFRSAQPGRGLEATLRSRNIASVLNLRGGSPRDWWYANEVATTRRLDVDFYDLPLSAERRPRRGELLRMIDLFGRCRYPLLIHCKSGSDRTGLAVALYRMMVEGTTPDEAMSAFNLWRGHVPAFGPERLHEPIREYAAWLRSHGLSHSPSRLRDWALREYSAPEEPAEEPAPLRAGPRMELAREESERPRR